MGQNRQIHPIQKQRQFSEKMTVWPTNGSGTTGQPNAKKNLDTGQTSFTKTKNGSQT